MQLGTSNPEYEKACRLERKLQLFLGSKQDWLMHYRVWLDQHEIPAETNGWPSSQAYDDHNINLFVKQRREESRL